MARYREAEYGETGYREAEYGETGYRGRSVVARPLLRKSIGSVLRRTRVRQGRTLADVARAARVSIAYLSELERGRKDASSEVLAAVCAGLRISLAQLVAEVSRELPGVAPGRPSGAGAGTPQAPVVSLDAYRALRAHRPGTAPGRRSRRRATGPTRAYPLLLARRSAGGVPPRVAA